MASQSNNGVTEFHDSVADFVEDDVSKRIL